MQARTKEEAYDEGYIKGFNEGEEKGRTDTVKFLERRLFESKGKMTGKQLQKWLDDIKKL